MKRTVLMLIAVLVIASLSSQPVLAASRSSESRVMVLMRTLYHQFLGFREYSFDSRDIARVIDDGSEEIDLRGDADHLGGGKIDDLRGNLNDIKAIPVDDINATETKTD